MSKKELDNLAVSPLMGATWATFNETTKGIVIDKPYKKKFKLTKVLCWVLSCLNGIEDRKYEKLLQNVSIPSEPVFILGHWRSGTTFVHNVLSQDEYFGYNTTYQTIFPNMMFFGQSVLKNAMGMFMPDKRPTDGMELNVDFPQEEEFALANMIPYSFYNFWFFPKHTLEYSDKYLLFKNMGDAEKERFKSAFERLIKTALWNTNGKQFLSKNPPHTGRIPLILEMFPNAKFVYLMRNPYTVFESTRSFFGNTIKSLQLQDISADELQSNILTVYKDLYDKYQHDKALIPKHNLIEMKFEDFEANPYEMTKQIYSQLQIPSFVKAEAKIKSYLATKEGHKKAVYQYKEETVRLVNAHWKFALEDWKYPLQSL
jgi:hypothetical protein